MSVGTKTEAIQENMFEKINDSPETEVQKKIEHVKMRNLKFIKKQLDQVDLGTQTPEE